MKDNKSIHEGHRQRLKNKFIENGFQGFEPHNILEMLLFYSIPRKDTNEIAHNLLNHFGSLKNVFNASFEDLIQVDGIKESSATLIKMIPQIAKEYVNSSLEEGAIFDTANKIGEYFVNKYLGEKNEIVYAMLLNNKLELLSVVKIHEGSVNSAFVSSRKILDSVIKYNASMLVLAHNHPEGTVCPSMDDINTTADLMTAFNAFDIKLIEHFVIAGNEFCPVIHNTGSLKNLSAIKNPSFKGTIDLKF
ncbi:MAG: hypothetical protein E7596_05165 [Ruminococcaceae bacterium]|nr:hypothetical protein [Oscillospiraceae bacterium]